MNETGTSWVQKSVSSDNLGQDIFNEIEKSSKTGQDKKSLISPFACVLTATG